MGELSNLYRENVDWFNKTLGVGRSMDIVSRDYVTAGTALGGGRLWQGRDTGAHGSLLADLETGTGKDDGGDAGLRGPVHFLF